MAEKPGPKLIKFASPAAPAAQPAPDRFKDLTPIQRLVGELFHHAEEDSVRNIAIFVNFKNGSSNVRTVLQPGMELWQFIDALKLRDIEQTSKAINKRS